MLLRDISTAIGTFGVIMREKPQVKSYFRSKRQPYKYYQGVPIKADATDQITTWQLRDIIEDVVISITGGELLAWCDPCSPFEAISMLKK